MNDKAERRRRSQVATALLHQDRPDRKDVAQAGPTPADPILALRGVGRALWADEEADAYVSRLREGWS